METVSVEMLGDILEEYQRELQAHVNAAARYEGAIQALHKIILEAKATSDDKPPLTLVESE